MNFTFYLLYVNSLNIFDQTKQAIQRHCGQLEKGGYLCYWLRGYICSGSLHTDVFQYESFPVKQKLSLALKENLICSWLLLVKSFDLPSVMCDSWCNSLHLFSAVCSLLDQPTITPLMLPPFLSSPLYHQLLKTCVSQPEKFLSLVTTLTLPIGNSEAVKKMIIKARQIYTLAKYHESCNFTQTQFSSIATTPGKLPSSPLSRWRLGFWIMTSSKSCIWKSALQSWQKCWSLHQC